MIDKIFPETLEILNNLIKFQTVSGSSNLELIKYFEKKLEEAGASSLRLLINLVHRLIYFLQLKE